MPFRPKFRSIPLINDYPLSDAQALKNGLKPSPTVSTKFHSILLINDYPLSYAQALNNKGGSLAIPLRPNSTLSYIILIKDYSLSYNRR